MRIVLDNPTAGRLLVDHTDDWRYGITAYRVKGPRVAGVFVVVPDVLAELGIDPDKSRVTIEMGTSDRSRYCHDWERQERPIVNGVPLTGSPVVDTGELRHRPLSGDRLAVRRDVGNHRSRLASAGTADRAAAVVDALLQHWLTRPEAYALRLHAAQAATGAVRAGLGERMRRAVDRYADARSDLNAMQHQLAALDRFDAIAHVSMDAA